MNQSPSLQQRMVELRIQDLHAQAAHARLVKEARAARRAHRSPSRISGLIAAIRWFGPEPSRVEPQAARQFKHSAAKRPVEC